MHNARSSIAAPRGIVTCASGGSGIAIGAYLDAVTAAAGDQAAAAETADQRLGALARR